MRKRILYQGKRINLGQAFREVVLWRRKWKNKDKTR